jgi:hypothetical protein
LESSTRGGHLRFSPRAIKYRFDMTVSAPDMASGKTSRRRLSSLSRPDARRCAHIGLLYLHIDVVFGFSSLSAYVAARRIILRYREVIEAD